MKPICRAAFDIRSAASSCFPDFRAASADLSQVLDLLERARGFEPPTPTLARLCSTPELHPRPVDEYHERGGGLQGVCCALRVYAGVAPSGVTPLDRRPCDGPALAM